jgi:hypothetical protein
MENKPKLKTQITKRWNIISDHQTLLPFSGTVKGIAFAQLEYILIEAGLLAPRRETKNETKTPTETKHANLT